MINCYKINTKTLNNLIDFIANEFLEEDLSASSGDMYADFLNMYTDDGINYNAEGAKFIVEQYKEVINDYFDTENLLSISESRIAG